MSTIENPIDLTGSDDENEATMYEMKDSNVDYDSDEEDPQLVECSICGVFTNITFGKCSNSECNNVFNMTNTGYYKDGFVLNENELSDEEIEDTEEEEEEFLSELSDEESENDEPCPWEKGDESDEEWLPH
jgi:hypothetical protein